MRLNKTHLIIVVVLLIVLGAAFYWYEWRPLLIRQECYKEAVPSIGEKLQGLDFSNQAKAIELKYEFCLHEKGLE